MAGGIITGIGAIGWYMGYVFSEPASLAAGHILLYQMGRIAVVGGPIMAIAGIITLVAFRKDLEQPEESGESITMNEQSTTNIPTGSESGPNENEAAADSQKEGQDQSSPDSNSNQPSAKQKKSPFSFRKKAAGTQEAESKKREKPKKSGFSLSLGKKKTNFGPPPTELIQLTGHLVPVPSYDALMKYGDITYCVKEPFQYVNLRIEEGEVTYTVIEPVLSEGEKATLKTVLGAYDTLVNSDAVLVDINDKTKFVETAFDEIIDIYSLKLADVVYKRLLYHLVRDHIGFGKIDALVNDRFIEDISCNGCEVPVYIYHRFLESVRTNIVYEETELNSFILRLAQFSGRHISILQPIRDAALPDGSRINMTLGKEVTKKGSTFTIRKFRSEPISPVEIMNFNTIDSEMLAYLWVLVDYGKSMLISGGTAAGKTTLLNAISMLVKSDAKIVSIEDTPEINLMHPNWVQAVTRVGFGESAGGAGKISGISGISGSKSAGDITLFDLLVAALRQRPEYIIVGEVRGEEAYTLFQAISVGHTAMGTIHAASLYELIARIESAPMNVPRVMVSNIDLVIFIGMVKKEGRSVRRVKEIVEILGTDPDTKELITNTIFKWDPINDNFVFAGRSFTFEKIENSAGVPKEKLYKELANRAKVFQLLKEKGTIDYRAVTDTVRQYTLNPEEFLNDTGKQV